MEMELIDSLIAEQKINALIFDFHRLLEKRDWIGIDAIINNFTVKEKLESEFGESNTAHRFVASESKLSFVSKSEAEYESILLNIGGWDGPHVRVCTYEKVRLKLNDQSQWQISFYHSTIDAQMFGVMEHRDDQSQSKRPLLQRIYAVFESMSS